MKVFSRGVSLVPVKVYPRGVYLVPVKVYPRGVYLVSRVPLSEVVTSCNIWQP